jgi:hypothetical protein
MPWSLYSRETHYPFNRVWVGPKARLDGWGKNCTRTRIRSPDCPAYGDPLYRLRYIFVLYQYYIEFYSNHWPIIQFYKIIFPSWPRCWHTKYLNLIPVPFVLFLVLKYYSCWLILSAFRYVLDAQWQKLFRVLKNAVEAGLLLRDLFVRFRFNAPWKFILLIFTR